LSKSIKTEHAYYNQFYAEEQSFLNNPVFHLLREQIVQSIRQTITPYPFPSLLSLGCGKGDIELALAPLVAMLTAIDVSDTAIAQANQAAQQQGIRNLKFVTGDVCEVETIVKGETFDVILAIGIFHHLPSAQITQLAATIHRLLRPGGMCITIDPNRYRLVAVGKIFVPHLLRKYHSPNEHELAPKEMQRLFRQSGFNDVTITYLSFFVDVVGWIFPDLPARMITPLFLVDRWLMGMPGIRRLSSIFSCLGSKEKG
jgi:2-polyprenyl-3-methyl-5-hydroxy-6-metoxy-1,4-benzoquinol methylase